MTSDRGSAVSFSRRDVPFFFLFAVLFLLVFRDFYFTSRVFYERDSTLVEIPGKKLAAELLKQGNFALWTDAHGNGQPFLANPKNAVFYPTTWLYLFLPFFTAFKLHYLVHALLGWLGLYALSRSWGLSRKGSFLGASLFAMSGMYLSSFEFYSHIAALCWMPWILYLLNPDPDRGSGSPRTVLLAFGWALMILAGAPEFILMTLIIAFGQAFFQPGEWRRRIIRTIVPLVLACLIAAVQLVPSLELLGRAGGRGRSGQWPLELIQLVNMPFPHFLGNDREPGHDDYWGWHLFDKKFPLYYSLYTGVGFLLLALIALRRPRNRKWWILLFLGTAFFLLACGRYSPFFFIYRYTPVLSSIRFPVKFFLGTVFCFSILAGLGFDRIMGSEKPGRKTVRGLLVAAAGGSVVFWTLRRPILGLLNKLFIIDKPSSLHEFGRSIETGLLLFAAFALILYLLSQTKSGTRETLFLGWAILLLATIDPAFHNRHVNPTLPASFHAPVPLPGGLRSPLIVYRDEKYSPFLKETIGDNVKLLGYFRKTLYPFTAMGDGVRYVFNWDFFGTYSRRDLDLLEAAKALPAPDQIKILKYLGCAAYVGLDTGFRSEASREIVINGVGVMIDPIEGTRPAPYAVFRTVRAGTLAEKLAAFTNPDFDPMSAAITDADFVLGESPPAEGPFKISIKEEIPGRGVYSVTVPAQAIAVFPGNFAPGWKARIDGRKKELFEANVFSKGLVVPAGTHEVVLRYFPSSFVWGAALSLVTIGWILVFGVLRRIRRRVRPASV
ncbi:MAG: DUF6044 family protein [Candidatus Aminicenantales bacterium]